MQIDIVSAVDSSRGYGVVFDDKSRLQKVKNSYRFCEDKGEETYLQVEDLQDIVSEREAMCLYCYEGKSNKTDV